MTATARRAVVLGATGCLGRQVTTALQGQGNEVIAVARQAAGPLPRCPFVAMDVATVSGSDLAAFLAQTQTDVVVNAIAGWGRTAAAAYEGNVRPVENLLDALSRLPAGPRLVQIGTVHEYGPVAAGTWIREDTEEHPESSYAQAKAVASGLVRAAVKDGVVRGVIVRVANTFGPHPGPGSFLGSLATRLRALPPSESLALSIANARRDYIDVRDAADAVVRAASAAAADPMVNVGSGVAFEVRDLVSGLLRAAGLPPETLREQTEAVQSLGGDWTLVDASRARRLLGWRPRFTAAESLQALWETVPSGGGARRGGRSGSGCR